MAKNTKFDRVQVIDKATNLYWQKGFHGTSMRHLQEVIDMRPGSIYAAFGSKEGLFKESLAHYTQQGLMTLEQCCITENSILAGLKAFVKELIIEQAEHAPNSMCMLAKTIGELTDDNSELLEEAKSALKSIESAFQTQLEKAQQLGEIASDKDCALLARHLQIQIAGLRTYAKAYNGQLPLPEMIEQIFDRPPF